MEDFIYVNETALSKEVCEEIIEKFEGDDRKAPGPVSYTHLTLPTNREV